MISLKIKNIEDEMKAVEELTKSVPGASTLNEAHFLYCLAKEGLGSGAIVEIGSFCGYSTIWLACGTKCAKREKVYAIDPQNSYMGKNEETFRENIKRTGVDDYIISLGMTSKEAAKNWGGKPIRLLFIDGNHEYEYVKEDFLLWEQYLINGGIIAFHDCFSVVWPDVLKCVKENIFDSDKFTDLGVVDLTLYAFKKNGLATLERIKKENFIKLLTPLQNLNRSAEKALISVQKGEFNKAERELKETERIIQVLGRAVSDFGEMMFSLSAANLYLSIGNFRKAEDKYSEVFLLKEVPVFRRPYAALGLGRCYLAQQRYKEAEAVFDKMLSLKEVMDNQRFQAILGMASCYTSQARYEEAEGKFNELLSLKEVQNQTRFHAILGLANCYSNQGKYTEAEEKYNEALTVEEVLPQQRLQAILNLANCCSSQGKYAEAEERFNEALTLEELPGQQRFHALLSLANCYSNQGKYTEAEEKYNEALLLEVPGQTKFHAILGIANCYSNQGKYTEAEEKFNETLFFEEVPDSEKVFAHYNLGSMYERGKDYAKAKNEFETVLVLGKDINTPKQKKLLGNTHFHLGCIYRVLNKLKQAKSEFENCLKLNPDHKKAKEIATTLNEGERNG